MEDKIEKLIFDFYRTFVDEWLIQNSVGIPVLLTQKEYKKIFSKRKELLLKAGINIEDECIYDELKREDLSIEDKNEIMKYIRVKTKMDDFKELIISKLEEENRLEDENDFDICIEYMKKVRKESIYEANKAPRRKRTWKRELKENTKRLFYKKMEEDIGELFPDGI